MSTQQLSLTFCGHAIWKLIRGGDGHICHNLKPKHGVVTISLHWEKMANHLKIYKSLSQAIQNNIHH